ncbi:unnamed protein product [Closterium sp. Naga37s-1]|nr:unnamed protein product [Closterium sp. Naga37s-1]
MRLSSTSLVFLIASAFLTDQPLPCCCPICVHSSSSAREDLECAAKAKAGEIPDRDISQAACQSLSSHPIGSRILQASHSHREHAWAIPVAKAGEFHRIVDYRL